MKMTKLILYLFVARCLAYRCSDYPLGRYYPRNVIPWYSSIKMIFVIMIYHSNTWYIQSIPNIYVRINYYICNKNYYGDWYKILSIGNCNKIWNICNTKLWSIKIVIKIKYKIYKLRIKSQKIPRIERSLSLNSSTLTVNLELDLIKNLALTLKNSSSHTDVHRSTDNRFWKEEIIRE